MSILLTVLGVLWFVIKIILWLILGILLLVILLLNILFWVPIRYEIGGEKYGEPKGRAKVTYLLRLLGVYVTYEALELHVRARIFFFNIYHYNQSFKKEEIKETTKETTKETPEDILEESTNLAVDIVSEEAPEVGANIDAIEALKVEEEAEAVEETKEETKAEIKAVEEIKEVEKINDKKNPENLDEEVEIEDVTPQEAMPDVKISDKHDQTDRINKQDLKMEPVTKMNISKLLENDNVAQASNEKTSETSGNEDETLTKEEERSEPKSEKKKSKSGLDQAKEFWQFLRADENQGLFKMVFSRIKKMLKSILPKKYRGHVRFGFEDPAMTGGLLGGISMFYPKYYKSLTVEADFEHVKVEGKLWVKGRIIPGVILYHAIRVVLDRRVRRLIRKVRSQSKQKKKMNNK